MYRDKEFSRSFAPVKEGEELDVKIEAVGEKGDGIAKVKGFVIFVPGAKQGQDVKIRINRVLRKVAFGEIVGGSKGEAKEQEAAEGEEQGQEESAEAGEAQESYGEDSESFGETASDEE